MNVRPAALADLDAIMHLWQERVAILAQADPRFKILLSRYDAQHSMICASLNKMTSAVLVIDVPDQRPETRAHPGIDTSHRHVAAYGIGKIFNGSGMIEEIALDMHNYHGGMGRALVNGLRAALVERGASEIVAGVPRYHPVEQAFWLSLGARPWPLPDASAPTDHSTDNEGADTRWQIPPEYIWMTL